MSTHNICLYKKVNKKYTGCNLKTTEFHECALIGVCAVIRSNTVCGYLLILSYASHYKEEDTNQCTEESGENWMLMFSSSLFQPPFFQDTWQGVQLLCAECNAPCQ